MTISATANAKDLLSDIGGLLQELTQVQQSLLEVLHHKRDAMARGEIRRLQELQPDQEAIVERLHACYQRRSELLDRGQSCGIQAQTLTEMSNQLAGDAPENFEKIRDQFKESRDRVRNLQLEHLTNWVIAQKSLLHVSQLLEIVATGGKIKPTYGKEEFCARGTLVDDEA